MNISHYSMDEDSKKHFLVISNFLKGWIQKAVFEHVK